MSNGAPATQSDHDASVLTHQAAVQISVVSAGVETENFFHEDLVTERNARTGAPQFKFGIVQRTHHDVDSHVPHPASEYLTGIYRGRGVSAPQLRQFLHDGVPAKGTVLVQWMKVGGPIGHEVELVCVRGLRLIDRPMVIGDTVKLNVKSAMSGTVTSVKVYCTLELLPAMTRVEQLGDSRVQFGTAQLLVDVPAGELTSAATYKESDMIIYRGWIGRVRFVEREIAVRLSNKSVVVIDESDEHLSLILGDGMAETAQVGSLIQTKKVSLRRGRWVSGAYDANIAPVGQIVEARPISMDVDWLFQRSDGPSEPPPSQQLDTDALESGEIHLYDRNRRPTQSTSVRASCSDFLAGEWVRFRDVAGATAKYNGTLLGPRGVPAGKFKRMLRTDTAGYDINTMLIVATRTDVTIQWQDLTKSTLPATNLISILPDDDMDELWPGDIVLTPEEKTGVPDWVFSPAQIGVVQSVQPSDRIAKVRWYPQALVCYYRGDGIRENPEWFIRGGLLPDAKLGELSNDVHEVSFYDVKPAPGLSKTLGDFVAVKSASGAQDQIDWFGEIVDTAIDGFVTVRLGALDEVRDVRLPHEAVYVVYSVGFEQHELGHEQEDSQSDSDDEVWDYDDGVTSFHVPGAFNGGLLGRRRTSVHDSEAGGAEEGWTTASESGDEMEVVEADNDTLMTDAPTAEISPPAEVETWKPTGELESVPSAATAGPAAVDADQSDAANIPPQYSVLEVDPPDSHAYITHQQSTRNMKTVQRQHKILHTSLPAGIFVRTWESRLDLLRVLFVGPVGTPYALAPFVIDIHLGAEFPQQPPDVFFHSWTGGTGPINPNLYEDGKVCLSLLGTWSGERTESWDPAKSTVLQVLVSILGLVLVKEPYYNEAGFEVRAGSDEFLVPSAVYSERTYFRSRFFITHVLRNEVIGLENVIKWLYLSQEDGAPKLLERAIAEAEGVIARSASATAEEAAGRDGMTVISAGAVLKLRQEVRVLKDCVAQLIPALSANEEVSGRRC